MTSTPNIVHGVFATVSFSAALASFAISIKLGALSFLKENLINGLCVDVWDGFFLSPKRLLAISFLMYLPFHCYSNKAPNSILCLTSIMGFPSFLFFIATLLEISPVVLPTGFAMGCFGQFGLSELRLAKTPKSTGVVRLKETVQHQVKSSALDKPSENKQSKAPKSPAFKRKRSNS